MFYFASVPQNRIREHVFKTRALLIWPSKPSDSIHVVCESRVSFTRYGRECVLAAISDTFTPNVDTEEMKYRLRIHLSPIVFGRIIVRPTNLAPRHPHH